MDVRRWSSILVLPFVACSAGPREEDSPWPDAEGVATGSPQAEGEAATADDGTSAQPGDDGSIKLDVGNGGAEAPGEGGDAEGCDKVDFLFVVDNSGSMQDEQQFLKTSFPGFIGTIEETIAAQDYHIMAISTDNGQNTGLMSTCTNGVCSCTPAPVCCENACAFGDGTCNGFDCSDLPIGACDLEYGSGKTYDENGNHCEIAEDRRYMLDTQPNVAATFDCIASVGTYGSGDEKPMLAMLEAVSAEKNAAGACNDGFLRDDAILVVTFITDEEDDNEGIGAGSPGGPAQWAEALVQAKAGNPDAVVVLGLVGDSDLPGGTCPAGADPGTDGDGAEPSPRLRSFVEQFDNGVVGSVCADDYTPFFLEAVSVIDTACEDFVPPG